MRDIDDDAVSEIQEESSFRHQYSLKSETDEELGAPINIEMVDDTSERSLDQLSILSVDKIEIKMECPSDFRQNSKNLSLEMVKPVIQESLP